MNNTFFAALSRMKYIERWALMRSSRPENLSEHAMEVAMIAHALCTIGNVRFGKELDADRAAVVGLFHDASEIITGDMPTPVKYYSEDIRSAYKKVEAVAEHRLLEKLPDDMRPVYAELFEASGTPAPADGSSGTPAMEACSPEDENAKAPARDPAYENAVYMRRLVKAADKLSAYIKCLEEETAGNTEFRTAKRTIEAALIRLMDELPEVKVFAEDFLPPYGRTLDELS